MTSLGITIGHINILAEDRAKTVDFYHKVFGFIEGKYVTNGRKNHLYTADGKRDIIHLSSLESKERYNKALDQAFKIQATPCSENINTGALDHIALRVDQEGFEHITQILKDLAIEHQIDQRENAAQVWFFDPNGVKLEVYYD